jgi:hypothetical protein
MKRIKILLLLLTAVITGIQAQVPQSFKYQAVVRNAEGLPLADKTVSLRFSLLQGSADGVTVYQEIQTINSNSNGVVDVRIGEGIVMSFLSFSSIDWSTGNYFLKTEIDLEAGTNFTLLGTSPLLSVPYARFAERSTNIIQPLNVNETDPVLFQVRDRAGNPVFVVYEDGVEVLLPEVTGKGGRGGFVVGGRSAQKGASSDIFRVNGDSARIYLNPVIGKGGKGGFAVGGRTTGAKGSDEEYLDITPLNSFIGLGTGKSNTEGRFNSFIGYQSGYSNTIGSYNTHLGWLSGYSNVNGSQNVFIGSQCGYSNKDGMSNVMIGVGSGYMNTEGTSNVFLGHSAGFYNTKGSANVFIGDMAAINSREGHSNVIIGNGAGYYNIYGSENIFLGHYAGLVDTIGNANVILGGWSGYNLVSGSQNVFIGFRAGFHETNISHRLYIDNIGLDSSEVLVYGEFDNRVFRVNGNMGINTQGKNGNGLRVELPAGQTETDALWIHGSGMAFEGSWQTSSDARLKKEIQSLQIDPLKILQLRPVEFEWKNPKASVQGPQLGFIAQEVEELFPEMVETDASGYKSIDYSKFSVLLISFVKEQNKTIESQQNQLNTQKQELNELRQEVNRLKLLEFQMAEIQRQISEKK